MSRIGDKPVSLPQGVKVSVNDGMISVEGPKGKKSFKMSSLVMIEIEGNTIHLRRRSEEKAAKQAHGTMRALIANAVKGVSEGFTRILTIQGVGYKAEVSGNTLKFNIGYSYPVTFEVPREISVKVEKDTIITLTGYDKELLGQVCQNIKAIRPADPYKLKGIKYAEEVIKQKVGKVGVGGSK